MYVYIYMYMCVCVYVDHCNEPMVDFLSGWRRSPLYWALVRIYIYIYINIYTAIMNPSYDVFFFFTGWRRGSLYGTPVRQAACGGALHVWIFGRRRIVHAVGGGEGNSNRTLPWVRRGVNPHMHTHTTYI